MYLLIICSWKTKQLYVPATKPSQSLNVSLKDMRPLLTVNKIVLGDIYALVKWTAHYIHHHVMLSGCTKHLWINFTSLVKQRRSILTFPAATDLYKPTAHVLCCNYEDNETHQLGQWIHDRYNTPLPPPTNALNWCISPLIQLGLGLGRDGPQSGSPNNEARESTAPQRPSGSPTCLSLPAICRSGGINRVGTHRDVLPGSGLKCVRTCLVLELTYKIISLT